MRPAQLAAPGVVSLLLLLLALLHPHGGVAQAFQVDRGATNVVRFVSRAATEEFEGVTASSDPGT